MSALVQWPRAVYWDRAWNPIIGCQPYSPACENCYAAAMCRRFNKSFAPHASSHKNPPCSGVVFVGNMTDLFGDWVRIRAQYEWFSSLWHFPARHGGPVPNPATYLWLTKRAANMARALENYAAMPHCLFGVTAENQEWYDRRRESIYPIWPARANLWLSLEPLLGPIDDLKVGNAVPGNCLRWVVVGCESGPSRRPCKLEWVESIVDQCRSVGVPVFVKQLDLGGKCETDINKCPAHLRIRQVPWAKEGSMA